MPNKSFDNADETRTPDKTRVDIVNVGGHTASRVTFQPGWKWTECIKPVAGTDTCQNRHFGVLAAGAMHVVNDDGSEMDLSPGDVYVIDPGHDAWVVGNEVTIGYEFDPTAVATFAKG